MGLLKNISGETPKKAALVAVISKVIAIILAILVAFDFLPLAGIEGAFKVTADGIVISKEVFDELKGLGGTELISKIVGIILSIIIDLTASTRVKK